MKFDYSIIKKSKINKTNTNEEKLVFGKKNNDRKSTHL